MKKSLYGLRASILILVSINAFSADWMEMRQWDKKMERLARSGNEAAIDKEQRSLELQLKTATGKEADTIRKKINKMNDYRLME